MDEFRRRPTVLVNRPPATVPVGRVSSVPDGQNANSTNMTAANQRQAQEPVSSLKKRSKWRYVVVVVCFVVLAALGFVASRLWWHGPTQFPASLVQSTDFPLYYPAKLPAGYRVDQKSLNDQTSSTLVYVIIRNGSRSISLSEQAKPPQQQSQILETTFSRNLSGSTITSTPYGDATIGIFSGHTAASLMTDKTWILVSAASPVTSDEVSATLKGLQLNP